MNSLSTGGRQNSGLSSSSVAALPATGQALHRRLWQCRQRRCLRLRLLRCCPRRVCRQSSHGCTCFVLYHGFHFLQIFYPVQICIKVQELYLVVCEILPFQSFTKQGMDTGILLSSSPVTNKAIITIICIMATNIIIYYHFSRCQSKL